MTQKQAHRRQDNFFGQDAGGYDPVRISARRPPRRWLVTTPPPSPACREEESQSGLREGSRSPQRREARVHSTSPQPPQRSNTLSGGNPRRVRSQHICILGDISSLRTLFKKKATKSMTTKTVSPIGGKPREGRQAEARKIVLTCGIQC